MLIWTDRIYARYIYHDLLPELSMGIAINNNGNYLRQMLEEDACNESFVPGNKKALAIFARAFFHSSLKYRRDSGLKRLSAQEGRASTPLVLATAYRLTNSFNTYGRIPPAR
jgi:hypothetical protein